MQFTYGGNLHMGKYKITNATFNQLVKDASSIIKGVVLLGFSLYVGSWAVSNVIAVYLDNTKIQSQVSGTGNTVNIIRAIPVSGAFTTETYSHSKEKIKNGAVNEEKDTNKKEIVAKVPNLYVSQEYPSSQNYQYTESIALSNSQPAVMTLRDGGQAMWFGLGNVDLANVANPTLFLNFDGDFEIKTKDEESAGWLMLDPDRQFVMKIKGEVQPGSGLRLNPLFVKFPKPGVYKAQYSITTDNNLPKSGTFTIKVVE